MAEQPKVGIDKVDAIILRAIELGLQFPPAVSRWKLLAWAAEEADLERRNPTEYARDGFRRVFLDHFQTPPGRT